MRETENKVLWIRKRIMQKIWEDRNNLICCIGAVFVWGLLAHMYGFVHNNLSHDGLNAFMATEVEELWKIELGRIFVPIYRAVFRGPVALPWLLGILGLLWTGLASYLVNEILGVRSRWLRLLVSGIMVTNITYIAQISVYLYEFDFNAFALLLAVTAVALWKKEKSIFGICLGSLCVMMSIGIYQAYFAVSIVLIILVSILELLIGKSEKEVFRNGLMGIGMLLLCGILYFVASKVAFAITGVVQQPRTDIFVSDNGINIIKRYIWLVIPSVKNLADNILHPAYGSDIYEYGCVFACLCLLASIMVLLIRRKYGPIRVMLIGALFVLLPVAMNCTYILAKGSGIHELMMYAAWFSYLFLLVLAFRFCDQDMLPGKWSHFVRTVACILVAWMLWQNVILANTAYVKKEREADATLSTMTRVVTMLEQQDGYVFAETPVAFYGSAALQPARSEYDRLQDVVGAGFNGAITSSASLYYYNAYKTYFQYVLNYPINLCDDDTHSELENREEVLAMPVFPNPGCMSFIDGILVVKMQ